MNRNKNGFTLVELLAVIVILAVILVIAVPQMMNTITESRNGALESSAKLIASSAESTMIVNQTLGIDRGITCEDVSSYNSNDYECSIRVLGNKPYVSLIGKGKFEGKSICYATKDGGLKVNGNVCPPLAVEKIEGLAITGNLEGLITDDFENIRYSGNNENVKNYINFNGEDWRIIGIFNVQTSYGIEEKLMKIVSDSSIGKYSWDSSARGVNNGYGINQWGTSTYEDGSVYEGADLMRELNTLYLNQGSGDCYKGSNNASTSCDFSTTGIKNAYRGMIESVVWNTGAFNGVISAEDAYNAERETRNGKECTVGNWCDDTVIRTTTWAGKVGLIYPSDYGYASTNNLCRENINDSTNKYCKNENWLHNDTNYWAISPYVRVAYANSAWFIEASGYFPFWGDGYTVNNVRPSVYLKSNVSITSGDGSSSNPYQLGM